MSLSPWNTIVGTIRSRRIRVRLGRGLNYSKRDSHGGELDESHESGTKLVVARGDTTELFELVKEALDMVALPIEGLGPTHRRWPRGLKDRNGLVLTSWHRAAAKRAKAGAYGLLMRRLPYPRALVIAIRRASSFVSTFACGASAPHVPKIPACLAGQQWSECRRMGSLLWNA